jgi:hypothetical protein
MKCSRRSLRGHDLGWDNVTRRLRARDYEPVVMYYSVTKWFPDVDIA